MEGEWNQEMCEELNLWCIFIISLWKGTNLQAMELQIICEKGADTRMESFSDRLVCLNGQQKTSHLIVGDDFWLLYPLRTEV